MEKQTKTELEQTYRLFFGQEDTELHHLFTPYAVCPLGAHVDHQQGSVSGFALDRGIDFLFAYTDTGKVELASLSFSGLMTFNVRTPMYEKQRNWGDYLRGVVWALQRNYQLQRGLRCIIRGSIPSGGIASSAALQCGFVAALGMANGLQLTPAQVISFASMAERLYIGLSNGILDQACVTLGKAHQLLFLDTQSSVHRLMGFDGLAADASLPFRVGIFYSGVAQTLTSTDYNLRVQECRAASWMLQAYAERPLKKQEESTLRDVPREDFERYEAQMPRRFACRARHFFTECDRVERGVEAWQQGDIEAFGQLMFESCESSINNYECGAPELVALYRILRQTPGVFGARFSGSGFLGSCIALVDPACEEAVGSSVREAYLRQFPQHAEAFQTVFCNTGEGLVDA